MPDPFENFKRAAQAASDSAANSGLSPLDVIGDPLITQPINSVIKNFQKIRQESDKKDVLREENGKRSESLEELRRRNDELRSMLDE